ncbi:hypothetical protein EZV62_006603 [Acer yangbiense]|uniref:Uncharacterized protein n=1 Tax=Acer yangbiense TaxID=1000413 RepID=A0A5C7I8D5_9ROSI|nr:hypothetical protein EZV62_006603 [Acer yangbiense]
MVEIAISVAAKIAEYLVAPVRRPFRYLWNYKTNLKNLKNEVEKLEAKRSSVERLVRVGEEPLPHVEKWQKSANQTIVEASKVVEDDPEQANIQCCKGFSCPNLMKSYQRSKNAAKKLKDVLKLEKEATPFLRKVSSRTNIPDEPWLRSGDGYEAFESRRSNLKKIIDALRNPGINVVGIYGMGGIGKTTLAKKVALHTKQDNLFDVIVFVEVSKTPDIKNIQQEIGGKLGLKFHDKPEGERARALYDQLKKEVTISEGADNGGEEKKEGAGSSREERKEKKILLILDNIWEKIDLERIGIPLGGDCKGLKLLLTTRNSDVLTNQMDSQCNFSVDTLEEAEAWSLFKSTAGMCVDHPDLKFIAPKVARECGNMPLAIVTIASALKNKGESIWRTALEELKNPSSESFEGIMTKQVYTSIKFSYDYLDTEELREFFLLCSRMGRTYDASIRDLFMYGWGLGFFKRSNTLEKAQCKAEYLVKKLKDNSLLLDAPNETKESHWYGILDGERFAMHDIICDVARSIDCGKGNVCNVIDDDILCHWAKKNMLKNCTSITLHNISKVPEDLRLEFLQLEFFYMKTNDTFSRIADDFFTEMPRLQVLHLIEMNFSPLPTSFSHLVNLQTLCLDACKLGDIADIGKLEKLEILSLRGSKIKSLPEEMRKLTSIRLLDLTHCSTLEIIPPNVISCFTQLEAFYMYGTLIRWEDGGLNMVGRNASLVELKHLCDRLTTLEICIPSVKMSEGLLSPQLKRYKISIGHNRISPPKNSRTLRVKLNTNDNADVVISQLKGIKQLELCADLKDDFTDSKQSVSLDALLSLESLSLEDLNLEKICNVPLAAESFCQLRTITVLRCDKLTNIFSFSIDRVLPKLQEIEVSSCKNMEAIFAIEREDDANNTKLIHEIQFSQLCSVTLRRLPQLKNFCHIVKTTSQLQLTSSTNDGEIISEDKIDIPKSLFNDKVAVPNLEKLKISNMDNLEKIWHNQLVNDSFCKLKSLEVEGCMKLLNVFPSNIHGRLLSLESLVVTACGSLEEIFDLREWSIYDSRIMLSFANLQKLRVSTCRSLKNLFSTSTLAKEGVVMEEAPARFLFPKLTSLVLYNVQELRSFYPGRHKVEGPVLKTLGLSCCGIQDTDEESQMQPPLFLSLVEEAFPCLEELKLTGKNVTMLWQGQNSKLDLVIQNLEVLKVWLCHRLINLMPPPTSFQNPSTSFHNLTSLKVVSCNSLINMGASLVAKSLVQLTEMGISSCEKITEVIGNHGDVIEDEIIFRKLKSLILIDLPSLTSFCSWNFTLKFPYLETLTVKKCPNMKIFSQGDLTTQKLQEVTIDLESLELRPDFNLNTAIQQSHEKAQNLENLSLNRSSYEEIFPHGEDQTWTKIKTLDLYNLNDLKYIWKQNSELDLIIQNLEVLKVWMCHSLINLMPPPTSFQNPTTSFQNLACLKVVSCNSLINIGTSSVAKSLVQLTEMLIGSCEKITEVIGNHGDVIEDEIIFRKLKSLMLEDLPSLTSFCSWNFTLKFPSLETLTLRQCPNMKIFSQGDLTTQKLQKVRIGRESVELRPDFNLNTIIQQSYQKANEDIWNEDNDAYSSDHSDFSICSYDVAAFEACWRVGQLFQLLEITRNPLELQTHQMKDGVCENESKNRDSGENNSPFKYKISGILSILTTMELESLCRYWGRKSIRFRPESNHFFLIKAFATGVILSTGFVHILPAAFESLNSPCLSSRPWNDFPFTGFVTMVSTKMVDCFTTGFYRRSHFNKALPFSYRDKVLFPR